MTVAALELNDQSLLIRAEDGAVHAEPGFAALTDEGVVTGEEARAMAWRAPQHVYNQYWCHLSQAPLPSPHRFARHNADIAFAQLRKLWEHVGSPESLMLLVPASVSREQLSLLLGMVEALPARASAVIDSALAACLTARADTLYVDLQMHDSILTVCRPENGKVRIAGQEILPGLGMVQIQNAVARYISDLLIEAYRVDPLHSSETEQAVFDEIPHWLNRLRWDNDLSVRLASDHGDMPCILHRDAIRALVSERLAGVRAFLDKWAGCDLRLSNTSSILTGLVEEFAEADVAGQAAGSQLCIAREAEFGDQVDDLYRMRALRGFVPEDTAPPDGGSGVATHLLCGDLALPLSRPVSISIADGGLKMSNAIDHQAALTVVMRNGALETLHGVEDFEVPEDCRPGESFQVRGHELRLIRVGRA